MANFPPYQFQPQQMNYQQQMGYVPNVYQPQYQQPMQQQAQQEQLFCRPVASADEARGVPVDFSGKPMFFPHLSAGKIYVKAFDPGSGSAVFREFWLHDDAEQTQPQDPPAPMSAVQALEQTIEELRGEIKALKATRRRAAQEVTEDA